MSFQRLVKWEQRMTGEKYSAETKEEYENKRKGCVKLLEIYRHLHQQGQVSKKMMHTMLFVNLRWSRWLTHSVFVRSARKGDWSAGAQETCVLAAKEIRRCQKSGRVRITWSQWLFWDFVKHVRCWTDADSQASTYCACTPAEAWRYCLKGTLHCFPTGCARTSHYSSTPTSRGGYHTREKTRKRWYPLRIHG